MSKTVHGFGRASLEVGEIYFIVMFADASMAIPLIQTLRYVKKSEAAGQGDVALLNDLSAQGELLSL